MGRHRILFPGGDLEAAPGRAGADILDHAGGGRHPVRPGGAMRCGAAMELPLMASGPGLRGTGDGGGTGGGIDPQRVAVPGGVGLFPPPGQPMGPDLPAIQRPMVGLVSGIYPGI